MLKRFNSFSSDKVTESKADGKITKLTPNRRNDVNKKLQEFLKTTYFPEIPLDKIVDVLNSEGLVALQEDNTEWHGLLCSRDGKMNLPLADITTSYQVNDIDTYVPMDNTSLVMTWHLMEGADKKYEIVGYVS